MAEDRTAKLAKFSLDRASDAVFWITPDARFHYANPAACEQLGYTRAELMGMYVFDIETVLTEEMWPAHWQELRQLGSLTLPSRHRRKDGSTYPVEVSVNFLRFEDQDYNCVVARDLTQRESSEAEIRKLALVASRTENAVVITDAEGRVEWVNESFVRITGHELVEVVGRRPGDFLQGPATNPEIVRYMREQLARGEGFQAEIINYTKAGDEYWVAIEAQPIHDESGTLVNFVAIETDVTQRKQSEEDLASAKIQAESANSAKSQFLANMSHEIRTPLTAISGFAQLLNISEGRNTEEKEWCQALHRNSEHLVSLVNDILDLSRIEAGQVALHMEDCHWRRLIEDVEALLRIQAEEKQLTLAFDLPEGTPELVEADALRLRQILINLVGNAIKFTESGSVLVRVTHDESVGHLQFDVQDTGVGIPTEYREILFEPFSQVRNAGNRTLPGTGLGLAISQQFAQMMGGEISVDSTPGQGSCFSLSLPVAESLITEVNPAPDRGRLRVQIEEFAGCLDGYRVLVVDDTAENRQVLGYLLARAGSDFETAHDGQSAVQSAMAAQSSEQPFDAILMDVRMPVMDGYEATRALRSHGLTTPIVALTAFSQSVSESEALAAGCDAYLNKPIQPIEVYNTLVELVDRPPQSPEPPPQEQPSSPDELFEKIRGDFLRSLPGAVAQLESGDPEAVQSTAHNLKGTAASYGYPSLSDRAASVSDADPVAPPESIEALLDELRQTIAQNPV